MSDLSSLGERLREARTTAGMSQTELAELSGVSQSTIANIESGRNEGSKHIVKIAEVLNTNVQWLVAGTRPRMAYETPSEQGVRVKDAPSAPHRDVDGPVLPPTNTDTWMARSEVRAGVDEPNWVRVEDRALCVKTKLLADLGTHPSRCRLIAAPDDSMEPFLFRSDLILVDLTQAQLRDGRMYAVLFEGDLSIRQVFKEGGGNLVLHAYNPRYPDKRISADLLDGLQVLGECIYRAGAVRP
ncbi:phage repressor protein C with HTH and peptisase S24 domain [Paraburkholderia tropica]|uniref:XRE family transcriptional regulator n=1 Tax=Paraburkholderia tropica TaxID=92647 RepID=UPI00160D7C78|nr:LexA family transcriptional regulator [Paraburkholderia tropica]MBB2999673.1 phage repressor protein C with HTH and peptisase S24 domain [Paraburkholderia tropica]